MLLCCSEKLCALLCNEFLVRGNNALASFKTALYEIECRIYAAHNFGNESYFVIVEDIVDILCELAFKRTSGEISDIEDILDIEVCSCLFNDLVLVFVEKFNCARTNYAET